MTSSSTKSVRFGVFELDLHTGELRKKGFKVPLQQQSFHVLAALLEKPGELVTREELLSKLWPDDTFVDFETSLNAVVKKLRAALGDSATSPRYIETLPKRGYRFIAPVKDLEASPGIEAKTAAHGATRPVASKRWLAIAAVAVLAATSLLYLSRAPETPSTGETLQIRSLTSYPGTEIYPAVAPDGERVAFAWDPELDGSHDIYLLELLSTVPVQLTDTPEDESYPAWSPDGSSIAFWSAETYLADWTLAIVPAVGGSPRIVEGVVGNRFSGPPCWLPDGRSLMVSQDSGLAQVFLDDERIRPLVGSRRTSRVRGSSFSDGGHLPAISPDGRTLAFARFFGGEGGWRLMTMGLDSSYMPEKESRVLTAETLPGLFPRCLSWTRDGSALLFSVMENAFLPKGLWRVNSTDGNALHKLSALGDRANCSSEHPDGRRLVYSELSDDRNIWRLELSKEGVGVEERQFLSSTLYEGLPHYSPDGTKIVFESNRSGTKGIWIANADGSEAKPLFVNEKLIAGSPQWSPDNRRVAFDATSLNSNADLYIINAAGGREFRLTNSPNRQVVPSWSIDGKWVYYRSREDPSWEVWKTESSGGTPRLIAPVPCWQTRASPDGKWFYCTARSGEIFDLVRIPTEGGEPELIAPSVARRSFEVTSRGVYFVSRQGEGEDRGYSIVRIDPDTHDEAVVWNLPSGTRPFVGLTLSPDGKYLLYDRYDRAGADLKLAENF